MASSSLESFRQELIRVGEFGIRAALVGEQLDQEADVADAAAATLRILATNGDTPQGTAAFANAKADEREAEAQKTRRAKLEWEDDIDRVYVLRLVTAFEVFLRQFVIEKASGNAALVCSFLLARDGLRLDPPLPLGTPVETTERISACVDMTCETFSNVQDASGYFGRWFGSGFLNSDSLVHPLDTKTAKAQALADVAILFQLRHILVHKSGVPNAKYHSLLTGKQCRPRLDGSMFDTAQEPPEAQPPDAILSSPAKYPGNSTKKDDLYESLLKLAEHIDGLYP